MQFVRNVPYLNPDGEWRYIATLETTNEPVDADVENIGGIDRTSVSFSPGVTVLTGRNATNRTSLLQGLMAGLGSENVSINALGK